MHPLPPPYPQSRRDRDRWIVAQRPPRQPLDPGKPAGFLLESERASEGRIVRVATIFLANRECPWRCLMCDLWKNTLVESAPPGAVLTQINLALEQLASLPGEEDDSTAFQTDLTPSHLPRPVRTRSIQQIKLYNSGSFFDPRAVPPAEDAAIAERVRRFDRVIVECHPAFLGGRVRRFRDRLQEAGGRAVLEVAMGLETAHPEVLRKLNKGMTLAGFQRAAAWLRGEGIAVRAFILVRPPFMSEAEGLEWAKRSVDKALDAGAEVCCLIPTRGGNGALDVLAKQGLFAPPRLATLEAALEYGVALGRGRIFADLWDLESFSACTACFGERAKRLRRMNLEQVLADPVSCPACEAACGR